MKYVEQIGTKFEKKKNKSQRSNQFSYSKEVL